MIKAYLRGQFVNLASGSVYPNFHRIFNHTTEALVTREPLHIGMDFNVLNITAILNVIRHGQPVLVSELTGVYDTPTRAKLLKDRFAQQHSLTIYPDGSGQAHKSVNASESDLSILRQNGFSVRVDSTNPSVRDRVNAMNAMILNAEGKRRWKANTNACPKLTEALEQQDYDQNGELDKLNGLDHCNDAEGYFMSQRYPIKCRGVIKSQLHGV